MPSFQDGNVEIQQIAQFVSSELQIADELSAMHVGEAFDGLHLNDHDAFDEQVQSIPEFEL
jgi:hypothetical protein